MEREANEAVDEWSPLESDSGVFRELLLVCWETLMGHFAAAAALA